MERIFSKTLGIKIRPPRYRAPYEQCHCAYCGKYVRPEQREYGYEVNCKDCERRVQR